MKISNKQEISLKSNDIHIETMNNRVYIKDSINFILDIGAPNVIFKNKKNISNFQIQLKLVN